MIIQYVLPNALGLDSPEHSALYRALYEVRPKALVQAVKRNIERFPADFMFQLNTREFEHLKSQFVISSWGGLRRAAPYAFTEQGVAMLSIVLRGKRAILVNVEIKHHRECHCPGACRDRPFFKWQDAGADRPDRKAVTLGADWRPQ